MNNRAALVIEDDDAIRTLITRVLIREGFDPVHEATDGAIGLDLLREQSYCVVVLDLWMPHLSGFDVLAAITRDGLPLKPYIVVVTADGKVANAPIALDPAIVTAVIKKPFDLDEFLTAVRSCFEPQLQSA